MRGRIYPKSENFVGMGGGSGGSSEGGSGGGAGLSEVITAAGDVAASLISSISAAKDAKLRRQYEAQLETLNAAERRDLNIKLLKAQTTAERRKILADTLSATNVARIQAANKRSVNIVLYIVGGLIVLGTGIYLFKKFRK